MPTSLVCAFCQLRQRIRQLNFISDGSFSGSVAKLPIPALSALIVVFIPVDQLVAVCKQLKQQGVRGDDLQGMITAVVGQLGKRVAGSAGERVAEQIGDHVADFFSEGASRFFDWVTGAP